MEIDIDRLRHNLMDYFGTAMSFYPQAVIDLSKIESATPEQLINIALRNSFDLSDYEIKGKYR